MRVIIVAVGLALGFSSAFAGKAPPAPDDEPAPKPAVAKPAAAKPTAAKPAAAKPAAAKPAVAKPKPKAITPTATQPRTAPKLKLEQHKKAVPAVDLIAVNLREQLAFRPISDDKNRKGREREVTRLFRCWHTGRTHAVDQRLARALWETARHFGKSRVEVYSAYRPKAYCTRDHSRHLSGRAVDFRIPGVANETVIAWLRTRFHPAGVGYYPSGVHVHLDFERDHDTYWIDSGDAPSSRPGPLAAVGDTSPTAFEDTADEITNAVALPDAVEPGTTEPLADPPTADPAL